MRYITPAYAAVAALIYIYLSVRTLRLRRALRIAIGDGDDSNMLRAIRVHGNFAEYAPFALLLIFMLELGGTPSVVIHGLCICLLMGRIVHARGVRQSNENFRFRVAGMALTFTAIGFASFGILFQSFLTFNT